MTKQDIVTEARGLLETHSIVAMRVDKPYKEIRPLIAKLCDEVERLRLKVEAITGAHVRDVLKDDDNG